jgi:hypothetical protein
MSSTTRIPKAEITGFYGYLMKRFSRKLLGDVAEPAEVLWHNKRVLRTSMSRSTVRSLTSNSAASAAAVNRPCRCKRSTSVISRPARTPAVSQTI